jgi:hypothetical protein
VILMSLLGVVVDELLDVGLDELHFGEDLVGGGGPFEGFWVGVPVVDVAADLGDEGADGAEGAAADRLAGDDAEPGFDLVDPRRANRGEVEPPRGFLSSQATTSGVVWVDRLSSTTWMSLPWWGLTAFFRNARKFLPSRVGLHSPTTSPVATFKAANRFVVPCRT